MPKPYDELTIADNFLFQKVMRNKRICKHLIERILHIKVRRITFPDNEKNISIRYDAKSIRLDVYVEDEQGRAFDLEMQTTNDNDGHLPKRTRYYQDMIDMDMLEPGHFYKDLRPLFIIFICTFDLFGKGLPLYTFRNRCVEESALELGDGVTKIFLNSKGHLEGLDRDVAAFLRYVDGKAAEGKFTKGIDAEVVRLKEHKETRAEYMRLNIILDQMKAEGKEEGVAEGNNQAEDRVSRLMKLLISKGKTEEALEASTDKKLRKRLYAEYGI